MSGLSRSFLKAMAERLEKARWLFTSEPELTKEYVIDRAVECMGEEWQNKIAVTWSVDDILTAAHPGDTPEWMTEDEAVQILCKVANRYDPTLGITWGTIDYYVQEFKNEKEKTV
jgi:hypothetical protein